jgi:hypothetical protein
MFIFVRKALKTILPFILVTVLLVSCTHIKSSQKAAKLPASRALYSTIAHQDSLMFDAFNAHDLDKLMSLFSENLEFFHDKGGLIDYPHCRDGFKNMFAQNNGIRRELVIGSLEVFPIHDYGAVETGAHRFIHVENGKTIEGTFKFLQIWQLKDGVWKVTRVVSYDH